MNQRITLIEPANAGKQAAELLGAVRAKLGVTPNLMKTLANSPAALEGYLSLNAALSKGRFRRGCVNRSPLLSRRKTGASIASPRTRSSGKRRG